MELFVGTSGYAYKEWKGRFYPPELPQKEMLWFYSRVFRSVEINNTFYRMPREAMLEQWAAEVPDDFLFVLKASQRITHFGRLKDIEGSVEHLFRVAEVLRTKLGPVLFQMPPQFRCDLERLRYFLEILPRGPRVTFEFRHESWFDEDVFALLRQHGAALCVAEADNDLHVPFVSTGPWGYLRLRRPDYEDAQLGEWLSRIRAQNWEAAFVFFKHEDEAKGPAMAKRFLELAGEPVRKLVPSAKAA